MTRTWQTRAASVLAALALGAAPALAEKSDAEFAKHAASDGMLEVQLGKYAATNGRDPAVRQFGERMTRDHQQANEELKKAAAEAGLTLPSELVPEHQQKLAELTALEGAEFDRRYMDAMVMGHEKEVEEFQEQAQGDSPVDLWAKRTVPTLQGHLDMARDIQAQTTRGASMPPASEHTSAP
jgi:putative membrane protein